MKQIFFSILTLGLFLSSCGTSNKKEMTKNANTFGEDFTVKNVVSFDDLLKKLETNKEMEVQVEGKVENVCQVKGCWMNIVSPKSTEASKKLFVKFHNYGFFMPLDLAGKTVVMKGKAFTEETSVDELRHYAEDAGKSAEEIAKITQPKKELKFMATGVKVKG